MHVPQAERNSRNSRRFGAPVVSICLAYCFWGIHFSQGNIHSMLASPRTIKKGRQPKRAISSPPKSIPNPGPKQEPKRHQGFATPGCFFLKIKGDIFFGEGGGGAPPFPERRPRNK